MGYVQHYEYSVIGVESTDPKVLQEEINRAAKVDFQFVGSIPGGQTAHGTPTPTPTMVVMERSTPRSRSSREEP